MSELLTAADRIDRVADWVENPPLQPVVTQIRDNQAATVQANFDEGHDPDGRIWPPAKNPLSPAGRKLMILTGLLQREAVQNIRGATATDRGFEAQAWGPGAYYGEFHDRGNERLPQRVFTGWGDVQAQGAAQQIVDYIDEQVANLLAF